MSRSRLSIIVIAYEMRREIARTLQTLTSHYQLDVHEDDYEVIVVDNSRKDILEAAFVEKFGRNFRLLRPQRLEVSPAHALNLGAASAKGENIALMIDGARMCSPGCIFWTLEALRAFPNAVITVPSWHLGPDQQNISVKAGYCQTVEDQLLSTRHWESNGYLLFDLCERLDESSGGAAWFEPVAESNFLAVAMKTYKDLDGFDEMFTSRGGGAVNLDLFKRLAEMDGSKVISLFGEGTFHQFHGGVSTNVTMENHPWEAIAAEYRRIRGHEFSVPVYTPIVFGSLADPVKALLIRSPNIFNYQWAPLPVRLFRSFFKVSKLSLARLSGFIGYPKG